MRALALLLLALLGAAPLAGQRSTPAPSGYWSGAAVARGSVQRVSAEFSGRPDSLTVRISSEDHPDRESLERVRSDVRGRLLFRTPLGEASMALDTVNGEMIGTVGPDSLGMRLHLKHALRPVLPPLTREEVRFTSGALRMGGVLLRPAWIARPAVAVFVHGRGCGPGHEMHRFGELVARYGIATLVYDQRGTSRSEGDCEDAGIDERSQDLRAALEFLRGRGDLDRGRIGAITWSAGAWYLAHALERGGFPLAFAATFVGPAMSVHQQQRDVMKRVVAMRGLPPQDTVSALRFIDLMFADGDPQRRLAELQQLTREGENKRWAQAFLGQAGAPKTVDELEKLWVRRHSYDSQPVLRRFRAPLLAVFGGSDIIVHPEENVPALERLMKEAGNTRWEAVVIPGAGHGLGRSRQVLQLEGAPDGEYVRWDRSLLPPAMEALAAFLERNGMLGARRP